jgi:hypothetical protein
MFIVGTDTRGLDQTNVNGQGELPSPETDDQVLSASAWTSWTRRTPTFIGLIAKT